MASGTLTFALGPSQTIRSRYGNRTASLNPRRILDSEVLHVDGATHAARYRIHVEHGDDGGDGGEGRRWARSCGG